MTAADTAVTEECIKPIRLFATEAGFARLETMSEDEVVEQQQLIEPAVHRLFQYLLKQRKQARAPTTCIGSRKSPANAPKES